MEPSWAWQQNPSFDKNNLVVSFDNLLYCRTWTLIGALFVHDDLLHLVGNVLFLFVVGNTLEKSVGQAKYLVIFLTGGLAGFVLSLPFMSRNAGMLGTSAAIVTIAACVMLVRPFKFSWLFLAPQGLVAIVYFFSNVLVV